MGTQSVGEKSGKSNESINLPIEQSLTGDGSIKKSNTLRPAVLTRPRGVKVNKERWRKEMFQQKQNTVPSQ